MSDGPTLASVSKFAGGFLAACLLSASAFAQFSFVPVYVGGDSTQQTATTSALNSLAAYFADNITLRVQVTIGDLGNSTTLGSSSASFSLTSGFYNPTPLYNLKTGTDLAGASVSITISMNTNAGINWGYGTGAPGASNYSWQTVVLHEVVHSMGFYDGIANNTGALANAGYTIFDSFTVRNTGNVAFTSYTTDAQRLAAVTSNDLYWDGAFGKAANGGSRVQLYAPATFEDGSTYSHVDPSQTGIGGALFPALPANTFFAGPTAVELGIMKDIGWSVTAIPEPDTVALVFALSAFVVAWERRRRRVA